MTENPKYDVASLKKFAAMRAPQRREAIFEMIKLNGSVRTSELSEIFKVSNVTIRLDLENLTKKGAIVREAGGAYLKFIPDLVRDIPLRHINHPEQHIAIAKTAVHFIEKNDNIILDSGPTTTEIAHFIQNRHDDLTVITSALNIGLMLGSEMGDKHGIEVIFTGGHFKPMTLSTTGQLTANFFKNIHANKLFLAGGVTIENGLSYPYLSDIPVKEAMIQSAETVYLVIPSYLMGRKALASLGKIKVGEYLITDPEIPPNYQDYFENQGIEVIIAEG